jgi:hypothetical protein
MWAGLGELIHGKKPAQPAVATAVSLRKFAISCAFELVLTGPFLTELPFTEFA